MDAFASPVFSCKSGATQEQELKRPNAGVSTQGNRRGRRAGGWDEGLGRFGVVTPPFTVPAAPASLALCEAAAARQGQDVLMRRTCAPGWRWLFSALARSSTFLARPCPDAAARMSYRWEDPIGCGRRDMAPGRLRTRSGGGLPHHLVGRVLLRPPIYCHARARPRVHSDASINK